MPFSLLSPRIPKGQRQINQAKWPVLSVGSPPPFDPNSWSLKIHGLVENPLNLSWQEFNNLQRKKMTADMHCVTTWTILDMEWEGVDFYTLLDLVKPLPEAVSVEFKAYDDVNYTTSLRLNENKKLYIPDPQSIERKVGPSVILENLGFHRQTEPDSFEIRQEKMTQEIELDQVLLATHNQGKPLSPEHGGPMRIIVPRLYAWKGTKWCQEITFMAQHELGFWEKYGYSDTADPQTEDRAENPDAQKRKVEIWQKYRRAGK